MWISGAPGMRPNLIKFVYYQYLSELPFWKSGPKSGPRWLTCQVWLPTFAVISCSAFKGQLCGQSRPL